MMVTMVLLFLAISGAALARAYAAQGEEGKAAVTAQLAGEGRLETQAEPLPLTAGVAEQALPFSSGSGPALAVLGGFLGWLSRRRVARRGAWCRAH
jgi:hypothetical protein